MKTKTINLYSFQELSEEAKEKSIQNLSDINVHYEWWESIYEDAERIGLKITSFDLDRHRHADGKFTLSTSEVAANIFRDHGNECETHKTAKEFMKQFDPVYGDYLNEQSPKFESLESENELMDLESDFLKSLLEDYSILLQKEYEYLTGKESIIETIEANEYTFTKGGKLERE